MRRYFLVYLDILGFEKKAKRDAEKTSLESDEVREVYRRRIKSKLRKLKETKTKQEYFKKECSIVSFAKQVTLDSWLLFTDNAWNAFRSIGEVLEVGLPMEIVIGRKEFKRPQSREKLIPLKDEVIDYLKSSILNSYRKIRDKKTEQTFVLLTKEVYESIDFSSISHAKSYKSSDEEQFYLIERDQLERILTSLKFLEKLGSKRSEYREIETLYI